MVISEVYLLPIMRESGQKIAIQNFYRIVTLKILYFTSQKGSEFKADDLCFVLIGKCGIVSLGYCNLYSDQATGWATKESQFDSRQKQEIFLFSEVPQIGCRTHLPSHSVDTEG